KSCYGPIEDAKRLLRGDAVMQKLAVDRKLGTKYVIDLHHLLAEVENAAVGEVQLLGVGDWVGIVRCRKFVEDILEVLLCDRAECGNLGAGSGASAAGIKRHTYRMRKRGGPLSSRWHLGARCAVIGDHPAKFF